MNPVFDFSFAWSILPVLALGAVTTLKLTIIGFLIAIVIALPIALARRSNSWLAAISSGFLIEFIRSTPLLIQIYFLFFVGPQFGIRLSPMVAGLAAIGLYYGCFIAEVYRAGLDSVPVGQWEAVVALNMRRGRAYRIIILPQAIRPMIPALGNYLIDMFKATPLLSVITVVEMMTRAKMIGAETFRYTEPMTLVGIFFLVMTLASSAMIRLFERYLTQAGATNSVTLAGT